MATTVEINAVVDAVIAAFDSDPEAWATFLRRSKLETDIKALESAERNMRKDFNADQAEFNAEIAAVQNEKTALQAEIDAL
jgi:hypothetical protein